MRQKPIGLHHIARVIAQRSAIQRHHLVDGFLQALKGILQALGFDILVSREEFGRRNHRIVQHGAAIPEAFAKHAAIEGGKVALLLRAVAIGHVLRIHAVDNLGQHHGNGLKRIDLVIAIGPLGPVLDRQDPQNAAAAQDGHAEEGVEGIFAGFRAVGERGMPWSILDGHGLSPPGNEANEAFIRPQPCGRYGFRLKALCRNQQQGPVIQSQIDRADVRHHGGRNDAHHLIQPETRIAVFRHHLAEAVHQETRGRQIIGHGSPEFRSRVYTASSPNAVWRARTANSV